MIIGGYSLHLYCDVTPPADLGVVGPVDHFAEFAGHDRADCVRQARKAGWTLHRDGKVTCPLCRGRKPPEAADVEPAPGPHGGRRAADVPARA